MKPMLYGTAHGFAEVRGYKNGVEVDGYYIVYDNGTELLIEDDGDFASWAFKNSAVYMGNYRTEERMNCALYRELMAG